MSNAGSPGAIRFAAGVEVVTGRDGRTLLLGGSPLRMMRLTEAGARWVGDGTGIRSVTPGAVDRLAWRMIDAGIAVPVIDAVPAEADVMVEPAEPLRPVGPEGRGGSKGRVGPKDGGGPKT
ncbi:MAG: hypothetical protein V9E99_11165 [Microthrixaceae bacterium]